VHLQPAAIQALKESWHPDFPRVLGLLYVSLFRQGKETVLTPIKRRLKDNVFKVHGGVYAGPFSIT
jgi:hypothetical protein